MSRTLQIVLLLAIGAYLAFLVVLLKKRMLNLKYSLLWIFAGILMLIFSLFPQLLDIFARAVGIYEATNALFAMLMFCGIIIMISLTSIASKMNNRIKSMAQYMAQLEKRLHDLEAGEGREEITREEGNQP